MRSSILAICKTLSRNDLNPINIPSQGVDSTGDLLVAFDVLNDAYHELPTWRVLPQSLFFARATMNDFTELAEQQITVACETLRDDVMPRVHRFEKLSELNPPSVRLQCGNFSNFCDPSGDVLENPPQVNHGPCPETIVVRNSSPFEQVLKLLTARY